MTSVHPPYTHVNSLESETSNPNSEHTMGTKKVVRRKPKAAPEIRTRVETCRCGALEVTFENDDRAVIKTTTERGAGWIKRHQWVVCSHCDTEIRYAPLPCWVGKVDGKLWTNNNYSEPNVENRREVPPR